MAFTQTPNLQTTQEKRIPITVGQTIASNVLEAAAYQGQRYINCYPKREKLANTDDKWVLTKVPGIASTTTTFNSSSTDVITCVSDDGVYLWKGPRLYSWSGGASLTSTPGPLSVVVSMHRVINASSTNILYAGFLENTGVWYAYTYNAFTNTFTLGAALPFNLIGGFGINHPPNRTCFFSGRLHALDTNGRIFSSNPGAYTTFNSTVFIVPETRGDECFAILNYKNHLVAVSAQSIEFYYDGAVDVGSPLVRQDSYSQLFGVPNSRKISRSGERLCFVSQGETQQYGIYTLDNFQVKKISNTYVDTLINNQDVTGSGGIASSFVLDCYFVNMFGDLCAAFGLGTTQHLAFNFNSGVWFEFVSPGGSISVYSSGIQQINVSPAFISGEWTTVYITSTSTINQVTYNYFSSFYLPAQSVTAEYVEDISDFGSQRWKTFYQVYFIGDAGDNTVELAWTPSMSYNNWSAYQTLVKDEDEYIKIDNIGAYRRLARRWRFTGTSNIMMEGSEVRYNLGSQ